MLRHCKTANESVICFETKTPRAHEENVFKEKLKIMKEIMDMVTAKGNIRNYNGL